MKGEDLVKRIVVRGKYKNMFAGVWRFASSWLKLEVHVGWFNDNGYIGCVDICTGRIWQVEVSGVFSVTSSQRSVL
jgi:hypothetical protein